MNNCVSVFMKLVKTGDGGMGIGPMLVTVLVKNRGVKEVRA